MINDVKDGVKTFYAKSTLAWREWLSKHHKSEKSVWLKIFKKGSGVKSVKYDSAVNEALCFGWVDSKVNKGDDKFYYQFFAKRNPKSNWSRINKEKVKRLVEQGKMHESGLKMMEIAKSTGTWNALDDVENLIIPSDMKKLFDITPKAFKNWDSFPRSVKRGILEWILNAKRPETRDKRIKETVNLAADNIRANQFERKK